MRHCHYLWIAIALAGCHAQSGNPFMKTTVPPPGTGAAVVPAEPYYGGAAPPPVGAPQAAPGAPPQIVVPPPDRRFTAPGGYNFPQGSVVPRKAVDPHPTDYRAGTSAIARAARPRPTSDAAHGDAIVASNEVTEPDTSEPSADDEESANETNDTEEFAAETPAKSPVIERPLAIRREPVGVPQWQDDKPVQAAKFQANAGGAAVRIVGTEARGEVASASPAEPMKLEASAAMPMKSLGAGGAVAIAPAAAVSKAASQSTDATKPSRHYFDRARPVSYTTPVTPATAATPTSNTGLTTGPDTAPAYSHDAGYQWLRGKLEYSIAARRWKLRYIPIDGQTDAYGGSVVLPTSPQLESFRPGQLVTVRGTLGSGSAESGGFSPLYELSQIAVQGG